MSKTCSRPWPPSGAWSPVEVMARVASTFTGVEHRIEPVRLLDGVQYYNDSIATSPTRTIAGLRSFGQKLVLIAGGYDKKISYAPLAPELIAHVKVLVLMGATGPIIEREVRACPGFAESGMQILHAETMQQAVELARAAAKPGDIVSLSPGLRLVRLLPPTSRSAGRSISASSTPCRKRPRRRERRHPCAGRPRPAARRSPPPSAASRFLAR